MKNGLLISSAGVGVFIALAPAQVLPCIEPGLKEYHRDGKYDDPERARSGNL
jgi:hypothetical protein